MSAWAKPGVKAVCVNTVPDAGRRWHTVAPVEGRTYTIHRVTVGPYSGKPCAIFEGLNNGFPLRLDRFRPLTTQDKDVALFTHILDGLPIEVDA